MWFKHKLLSVCFVLMLITAGSAVAGGKKDAESVPPDSAVQVISVQPVEESVDTSVPESEEPGLPYEGVSVRAAALNGPSGIPMAYLFENPPALAGASISFEIAAAADVLLPKLLKGEVDIGILPPNVAAKVYTKNNGAIVVGAVVGNGMLSLITRDTGIRTLEDLKGKTVSIAGQGATPEYMFRYLLAAWGISVAPAGTVPDEESVALDFSIPTAEIPAAIISGKINYAVVPEPFSTVAASKDSSIFRAIDIQQEFAAVEAAEGTENYPMTVVVIRAEFARQYPELVRWYLDSYRAAVDWTNANPEKAGVLVQKHTLGLLAPVAARVIPNAAYVYQPAREAKPALENLFTIFLNFAPDAVGGSLPDDGFYFD